MATNPPTGDGQRKGAVRKRSQLKTKMAGESQWTKRDRTSGAFMANKKSEAKFKAFGERGADNQCSTRFKPWASLL
jgi:hypothetical protein